MFYQIITTILLGIVAVGGFFFPQYNKTIDESMVGLRTDGSWNDYQTYLSTAYTTGRNILINGSNKYVNFNTTSGSSGYGIRDNAGTIECKNSGGSWGACADGTGTTISQLGQIPDVATSSPMTYGEMLIYNTSTNKWESVATSTLGISVTIPAGTYDPYGQATSSLLSFTTPYYATTTHPNISSLPALSITKSQVSDFGTYENALTFNYPLTRLTNAISLSDMATSSPTSGTGISLSGTGSVVGGSLSITNSAPDQTVALTNGTFISVTGTYPNFTINNTNAFTQTVASTTFVARNDWTTIDNYPTGCTNQFIRTLGDTLTCASVANTDLTNSTIGLTSSGSITVGTSPISLGGTSALDLNMANPNSWTGLQTFANASTTLLTAPDAWITKLRNLTDNGFVKTSNSDGTLSIDTATYLTSASADSAGYAKYAFGSNNFTGTGNFITSGTIMASSTHFTTLYVDLVAPGKLLLATSTAPDYTFQYDTDTGLGWVSDNSTALYVGGNAKLTVNSAGLVTMGNASTTQLSATTLYGALTGNASTATALAANPTNCSAGNFPLGIDASGAVESCTAAYTAAGTHTGLIRSTAAGTSYITGGNVGIGTTGPGAKLDVNGTTLISQSGAPAVLQMANGVRTWQYIADDSPDFLGIYDGTGYRLTFEGTGDTYFNTGAGSGFVGIGTVAPLSKLGVLGNLAVGATYGAIAAPTSGMIIEGNVGIGETAPGSKLSVMGGMSVGNDVAYSQIAAPTDGMIIKGNVGIGTTTPNAKLVVNGDISFVDADQGIALLSPNGTRYRVTVSDDGYLETETGITLGSANIGMNNPPLDIKAELDNYFKDLSFWDKIVLFIKSLFI